ncbi:MAG TPA: efflux RND transporter permease subunit [Candidatus Saccharimonadales bacterium]|nr:efflux RND transporter permease subunit [Candidatus Saccharimonadales bacterium]
MKNNSKKMYKSDGQDRLLPKVSLAIFNRPRAAALVWLLLTVFGVASYTTFLQREGFPSINVPFSVAAGTYFVNDPAKVDAQVAGPVDDIILKDSHVKSVQSTTQANFYNIAVQYKEGTDANVVGAQIKQRILDAGVLPESATLKIETPKPGFTARGDDGVVSVYASNGAATTEQLSAEGDKVAAFIKTKHLPNLLNISVVDPFVEGTDPVTRQIVSSQDKFDRYGARVGGQNRYYDSVSVGYTQKAGSDVIKLDDQLQKAVDEYNGAHQGSPFTAVISATYANDIKEQIGGLQKSLLEGLVAVLVVGSLVIAVRASLITVLAMLTVLTITLGALYLFGYTLNTITLFSLVLCLALIVDDTIIMVEAIDAQRRKLTDPQEAVHVATRKVSRAMVAATSTAVLSFAPLLFVSGILGSFIRAIPVTVIASLVTSLLVALFFIPLFARYLLLGKKQMGPKGKVDEPAAGIEAKVANFVGKPMLWARGSTKKLLGVGSVAVVVGLGFIVAAGFLFQKVTFNIFPPSKDTNGLTLSLTFNPGTTIKQAEGVADRADTVVAQQLGENFKTASYFTNANTQSATSVIYLISFKDRKVTSPQLKQQLKDAFMNFHGAQVEVGQLDVGPPPGAFGVRIVTGDRAAAMRLASDMNDFLHDKTLTRVSGKTAKIVATTVSDPGLYQREGGKQYVEVTAKFDADDTSTLVALAQDAVKKEFTDAKLQSYGLKQGALDFDLGQEADNQNSFAALTKAFPVLLVVIFVLLAVQFRSLLQPLLIFMAIPFSLFGITLGLYATKNAFSFFTLLGFFALLGLSIKNTILLTDYANQLRRGGAGAVEAAVGALRERFRPLIATSFTAVVSLIPLYLSDPFWEGLTVVLICGLLSSTFLVITVFPYYYLGAEFARQRISRRAVLIWLVGTAVVSVGLVKAGITPAFIPLVAIVLAVALTMYSKMRRTKRA